MHRKTAFLSAILLALTFMLQAQINLYLGGNLQGNYSWLRGDEATFEPGFGGGVSFVYW